MNCLCTPEFRARGQSLVRHDNAAKIDIGPLAEDGDFYEAYAAGPDGEYVGELSADPDELYGYLRENGHGYFVAIPDYYVVAFRHKCNETNEKHMIAPL